MENSIIDELLYKAESIMEKCRPRTKDYTDNSVRQGELRWELIKCLSAKQKKLFEEYEELSHNVHSDEIDEAFKQGTSLGVRFTAEAFVIGREIE